MATTPVEFWYYTGLLEPVFANARLRGSWDEEGRPSATWSERPMEALTGHDGSQAFRLTVELEVDPSGSAREYRWGVVLDGPQGPNSWGIATEIHDAQRTDRHRVCTVREARTTPQIEAYYLTWKRRLGAHKYYRHPGDSTPDVRFAVWAPNARSVEVVFGLPHSGYIYDDGRGIDPARAPLPLLRQPDGIWEGVLPDFASLVERVPYMYRIVNAQGRTVYRSDVFARSQAGAGAIDPRVDASWPGTAETLDGSKSCSLVIDPDCVECVFEPRTNGMRVVTQREFWASELDVRRPLPSRVEDLVIYELHVGALGFGTNGGGTLRQAVDFLDHLVALGVNCVELLPMSETSGEVSWGYGDTHHFCIETSAGGYDDYRCFVRECHRRGIAVIQDVVYNHYDQSADRAQWQFDSDAPEQNIYYWYEGRPEDYTFAEGGYLDNGSSGWAPRYWEEAVRQQFISSAAFLIEEMHVDGLRVDLTQAIHRDNSLHADGRIIGSANLYGQKLLRELSRTLRLIRPHVMLIAEDHTGWEGVTRPTAAGGLGFDATWYAELCHHLVGDADGAGSHARLIERAGYGGDEPLAVSAFARVLSETANRKVVYHKNHDECGNASGTARTVVSAVNHAPLFGPTRNVAEARARVCFGLTLFSAGTPLFFMGEEIASQRPFIYGRVYESRDDLLGERNGHGASMFRFYQDAIHLSRRLVSTRERNLDILHVSDDNRVLAFKRWTAREEVIVVASLQNRAFAEYEIRKDPIAIPAAGWTEIFNSDAFHYGGANVGNSGATLHANDGALRVTLPASGFVVLARR